MGWVGFLDDEAIALLKSRFKQASKFFAEIVSGDRQSTIEEAMIDPLARRSLSQDVRRLVTGRMTNDDFDELYFESYGRSDDAAVRWIAEFCWGLYSDQSQYRLRGRHAVNPESRSTAARSVLFLRSGLEYQWPPSPDDGWLGMIADFAMILGIPAGIALLFIGLTAAQPGANDVGVPVAIFGLALLAGSTAIRFRRQVLLTRQREAFVAAGDFDVWPFLNRDDFDRARRECHLLGK